MLSIFVSKSMKLEDIAKEAASVTPKSKSNKILFLFVSHSQPD